MLLFGQDLSSPKKYTTGTHRSVSPSETLRRYEPLMPRFEITRLADITGLDTIGLPVFVAIRPNSRSLATSQGKGWDRDSARASALMESIESWHGERARGHIRFESYQALTKEAHVIDAAACSLRAGSIFRGDAPHYWLEAWDVMASRPMWVPYEAVSLNFVHGPGRTPVFALTSNGQAAGNDFLEATIHALCELIERDAQALWSLGSETECAQTKVDPATVKDATCRATLELLDRAGVEVGMWDLTSDVGVPVYSARVVERQNKGRPRNVGPAVGYGCHLAPEVALMRAVSEAVQSRAAISSGSRDDLFYRDYRTFMNADSVKESAKLMDLPAGTHFGRRASLATDSFEGDLQVLLQRLRAVGITQIAVSDLSDPAFGIPVVKVIAPGLEGLRDRLDYQPGHRAKARMAARSRPS